MADIGKRKGLPSELADALRKAAQEDKEQRSVDFLSRLATKSFAPGSEIVLEMHVREPVAVVSSM